MATSNDYKKIYGSNEAEVRRNLTTIELFGHQVPVHMKAVPYFLEWESRVRDYEKRKKRGVHWRPKAMDTFCWRLMRGGSNLSRHSFGIAVDIDWDINPYKKSGTLETDIPSYVARIADECGITWGGSWTSPIDAMHFEVRYGATIPVPRENQPYMVLRGTTTIAGAAKIFAKCALLGVLPRSRKAVNGQVTYAVHLPAVKVASLFAVTGRGVTITRTAKNAYLSFAP